MSGALDFKKYYKHREDARWRIKFDLLLSRCGDNKTADTLSGISGLSDDGVKMLSSILLGEYSSVRNEEGGKRLDIDSIKSMTDDQRMELYKNIMTSVFGEKNG